MPSSEGLPAPSPSLPPAALAPHIEDALVELRRAEAAVDQLLGPLPGAGASPSPEPLPPPPRARPRADKSPEPPPAVEAGDRCAVACRALASMTSAAGHLCSLAGETDARCQNARARVENARSRVHASCPSCAHAP